MAARRTTKRTQRDVENWAMPPPAPGAEWADPEEIKAFWGKSVDEFIEECEREHGEAGEREVFLSDDEFLAALRREMKPPLRE